MRPNRFDAPFVSPVRRRLVRRLTRRLIRGLALGAGIVAAACAATGGPAEGELRVTLRDYESGARFELVSESHTDRVELYSEVRTDAATKVQTDEVLDELVDEIERLGFDDYAQAGRAPRSAHPSVSRAFEVQRGGSLRCWLVGRGTKPDEYRAFHECMRAHLAVYNLSQAFQSVENPRGQGIFEQPERPSRLRR